MINIQDVRPVYLFYGSERFLLQAALQELIAAVAPGDNPFNLTRLNGERRRAASPPPVPGKAPAWPRF